MIGPGKKIIQICMGSSCFSRGNKKILQIIQQYIRDHQLDSEVALKGNHCFGTCNAGPILKIGSTVYEGVDGENILEILQKELDQSTI